MKQLIVLIIFVFSVCKAQGQSNTIADFFDQLPLLPNNGIQVGQASSHSPHQRNSDAHHFLYRDSMGDAVIFDVAGPGCVTSMWGTMFDPESVLKFYFDGEERPRYTVNTIDFYKGNHPFFPTPFVSYDRRGYYLEDSYAGNAFMPIVFDKSLRISIQGKPAFYHILYEKYPYGTDKEIYSSGKRKEFIHAAMTDSGNNPWEGTPLESHKTTFDRLNPGETADLLKLTGSGAVRTIEIETDARKESLENLRLLMIWDDAAKNEKGEKREKLAYEKIDDNYLYHVNAPLGFFFGSPYQALELKSLPLTIRLLGNGRMRLSCYLTMPYWRNARISLLNKSTEPSGKISAEINTTDKVYPQNQTGYFTTRYRKGLTEYGRNWIFAQTPGAGWFIGVIQSCRLEHYCEGNEHFHMDGNHTPQINGTGTEDYYLGCFWPNKVYHTPFAGCVNDVRIEGGGDPNRYMVCLPTDYTTAAVYYRFHMDMPLPFYQMMDARIQHGGENQIESEYASLAYLYLKPSPVMQQTDYIDIGNQDSRRIHNYQVTGKHKLEVLYAKYEGDDLYTDIRDAGMYHKDGTVSFSIALDPENNGVRIRRRADQSISRQKAAVYVDGKFAGIWYDAQSNNILCWYDSEFNIHSDLTQNKGFIEIRLVVDDSQEWNFKEFEYAVFCYK